MPNSEPSVIRELDTILSNSQLLALSTAPVTLLAAPGTGFFINVLQVIWIMTGTGSFNGGLASLLLGTTSISSFSHFINSGNQMEVDPTTIGGQVSSFDNQPLKVGASSNSTVGGGVIHVRVYYTIEATT